MSRTTQGLIFGNFFGDRGIDLVHGGQRILHARRLIVNVLRLHCILAAILVACSAGCSKPFVPAARCHLVTVKPEDGAVVLALLDGFATANGLSAIWKDSHGRLFDHARDGRKVSVHYRAHDSEQGAELTFFRNDSTRDAALSAAFDQFVAESLAARFTVRNCSDVPGYAPPSSTL